MAENYLDLLFTSNSSLTPAPSRVPLTPSDSSHIHDGWLSPNIARVGDIPNSFGLVRDETIRTMSFTAAVNTSYQVSAIGSTKTVTLPSAPADMDRVEITGVNYGSALITIDAGANELHLPSGVADNRTFQAEGFHFLAEFRTSGEGGQDRWEVLTDEVATRFGGSSTPAANAIITTDASGFVRTTTLTPNTVLARTSGSIAAIPIADIAPTGGRRFLDVQAATIAQLPAWNKVGLVYTASTNGVLTVDGFAPTVNDLILVAFETEQADTGVFRVTNPGTVSTPWVIELAYQKAWQMPPSFDIFRVRQGNTFAGEFFTYGEVGVRPIMIPQPLRINATNLAGAQTIRLFRTHYVVSPSTLTLTMPNYNLGVIPAPRFAVKVASGSAVIVMPAGAQIEDPWSGNTTGTVELPGEGAYSEWEGRSDQEGGVIFRVVASHAPIAAIANTLPSASYATGDFSASPNTVYLVSGSSAEVVVGLLPAAADAANSSITVKHAGGIADVEITAAVSETIDGGSSVTLLEAGQSLTLYSTGTEWVITSAVGGGGLVEPEDPEDPEDPPGEPTSMLVGMNTWFLSQAAGGGGWAGEAAFVDGINWATAIGSFTDGRATDDFWNPAWITQIAPYSYIRFMDWGQTNFSGVIDWAERRLPTANQYEQYSSYDSLPDGAGAGMAYEWMIDLCNRHGKDMWVCVPHRANNAYVTNLATLIRNNLDPGRRVFVEYSNETWNFRTPAESGGISSVEPHTSFTGGNANAQLDHTVLQGTALSLPGSNIYYQGGAYNVYRSLQIFEIFEDVFGASDMGTRVIRTVSASGNLSILGEALADVYASPTWNPDEQEIDLLCSAPYLWGDMDGAALSLAAMETEVDDYFTAGDPAMFYTIKNLASTYGISRWGCYEAGMQSMENADQAAENLAIMKPAYRYMLNTYAAEGCFAFSQYSHTSDYNVDRAWGAVKSTDQDIGTPGTWTDGADRAPKYEAIWEFWNAANLAVP